VNFKELLYQKKLKQSELAKLLRMDTGRVSLCVNGVMPFPKKYHQKLEEVLGVKISEGSNKDKRGKQNER
jgi:hypothetical protein